MLFRFSLFAFPVPIQVPTPIPVPVPVPDPNPDPDEELKDINFIEGMNMSDNSFAPALVKPINTQRPFTPKDKQRTLFGRKTKNPRPPSSFRSVTYLYFISYDNQIIQITFSLLPYEYFMLILYLICFG